MVFEAFFIKAEFEEEDIWFDFAKAFYACFVLEGEIGRHFQRLGIDSQRCILDFV
jgi:hypothetical protein